MTFDETPGGAAAAFSGISQYIGAARVSGTPDYDALQKAKKS
jgi:hypothetical protein